MKVKVKFALLTAIVLMGIGILVVFTTGSKASKSENVRNACVGPLKIIFGTRSHPCQGECCSEKGICLIISFIMVQNDQQGEALVRAGKNLGLAEFNMIDNNTMQLSLKLDGAPPDNDSQFRVNADIPLGPEISQSLGFRQVIIKKGIYTMDFSKNPLGIVDLDVNAH